MNSNEERFGYESTNLYKFDEEDQEKIVEGLQGDNGMKLTEKMLDTMSEL